MTALPCLSQARGRSADPLLNAMITAAIANGGGYAAPYLVDRVRSSDLSVIPHRPIGH